MEAKCSLTSATWQKFLLITGLLLLLGCSEDRDHSVANNPNKIIPGVPTDQDWLISGRIFFDYDSADILERYRPDLQRMAAWLIKYQTPYRTVTIEGHTDERGTREYNLALGKRRAEAMRRALIALGVPASRISTISYGKERPAVAGSNEAAWSQNRRAVGVLN